MSRSGRIKNVLPNAATIIDGDSLPVTGGTLGAKMSAVDAQLAQTANYPYTVNPLVYNEAVGLRKWRAALAGIQSAASGIININVVNNSIGEGYGAGDTAHGWTGLLRAKFATLFEDVGFGLMTYFLNSYYPTQYFAFSAGWTDGAGYGIYNKVKYTNTNGVTATVDFTGTGVDILCVKTTTAGAISVVIDGGAAVEYATNNTPELKIGAVSITGLADTTHTMVITKTNDSKFFWLIGICPTKGTKGVRINLVGQNGGSIHEAIVNENALYSGIDYWTPALTIVEMFANELTPWTPTLYKAKMQTMISRAATFGSVLLFPTGVQDESGDYTQQDYIDTLYELAISNNCAMLDCFNYWGGTHAIADTLGVLADAVHPNAKGHQDLFNLLSKHIL